MDPIKAQLLINSGMAWKLEGHIGRTCMAMIENGMCMLGTTGHRDYWGNYVPARTEVQQGTKGSRAFVVEMFGEEQADELELLPSDPGVSDLALIF